jgi:UDP:flavonoid glycosyltransferase YjiC (YdhE family)
MVAENPARRQPAQPEARPDVARIVITTMGSLGDLHPYLALALGLRARGHDPVLATAAGYRRKIEALGLGFRAVRPDNDWMSDPERVRYFMDLPRGLVRLGRELYLPVLRDAYDDTLAAVEGAELLVSQVPLAARLVADKTGIPWASTWHIPLLFFSAHDLVLLPVAAELFRTLRWLGPAVWGPLLRSAQRATRFMAEPWYRLRAELGLPPATGLNPLGDSFSPTLVLALFSQVLADKQPDWPPQTVVTGFPWYHDEAVSTPELVRFLNAGPPPVVFTLGSVVGMNPGRFYEHSVAAAGRLGRRAVLILPDPARLGPLPGGVTAVSYAPFSELFPRAAAVVHHGGIGTTGLALRAGRPTLVVPFAWDQPDNANRVVRLGVGRTLPAARYTPARVAAELGRLLDRPGYARRAAELGERVRQEDGVRVACDALERLLRR